MDHCLSERHTMAWLDDIIKDRAGLMDGANPRDITDVQDQLGVVLPSDFVQFLTWADGGFLPGKKFIVYSVGSGIHPSETLTAANKNRPLNFPLVAIGCDAEDDFGFKKSDLPAASCPVYFYNHEEDRLDRVADSFSEFLRLAATGQPLRADGVAEE
jgi:hypothetical protein